MNIINIILIAISLAADAFSVALAKGLSFKKIKYQDIFKIGIYFGIFQMFMPILGYIIGSILTKNITTYDQYIAFGILFIIGFNMLLDSRKSNSFKSTTNFKEMIFLSVATSIDAFAIGVSFSVLKVSIISSSLIIGFITFLISSFGVFMGYKFGKIFESISTIAGGIILIIIAFKMLFIG